MKPTHAEVYDWAKEAQGAYWRLFRDFMPKIETIARLAYEAGRADENEACAKMFNDNESEILWGSQAASAIRARREQ